MDSVRPPMRFTQTLVALWLVLSVVLGAFGPFGTYYALDFPARLTYWAGVVGFCLTLEYANQKVFLASTLRHRVLRRVIYILIVSVALNLANGLIFEGWAAKGNFFQALKYVVGVVVFAEGINVVIKFDQLKKQFSAHSIPSDGLSAGAELAQNADPAVERLLAKLPTGKRGNLQHLEAQGHYLKVVTSEGEAKILMRLRDAMADLPGGMGLQVHRSHWVALEASDCLEKISGKVFVRLVSGALVPVSRGRENEVRSRFETCSESTQFRGKSS